MSSAQQTRLPLSTVGGCKSTSANALRITILFHPDLERIGQFYWVDLFEGSRIDLILGRDWPVFSDGFSLQERHVSRRALRLEASPGGLGSIGSSLRLSAQTEASCRIGPAESSKLEVDGAELSQGVVVRLGHGVVLFIRSVPASIIDQAAYSSPRGDSSADNPIVATSPEILALLAQLDQVAISHLPVLLLGESGVGKELLASRVHRHSQRADKPWKTLNMAALPEHLAAAELFGSERGAFTGAEKRLGVFREVDGGSLFLDEIGDAPESVQTQLLRAIATGEIQTLGGVQSRVDVRLIAATDQAVESTDGFRGALFHRLAGIALRIPPLRERREDVGVQMRQFLTAATASERVYPLDEAHKDPLIAAQWGRVFFDFAHKAWLGNTRELEFACSRLTLGVDRMPQRYAAPVAPDRSSPEVSNDRIVDVYKSCDFEVSRTAEVLNISRAALYRRLEEIPECNLVSDLSDEEIGAALSVNDSPREAARELGVSWRALKPRLRWLAT